MFRCYLKTKTSYKNGPSTTSEPICIPLLLPLLAVLFHIKLWDLRLLSQTTTPVPFDLRVSLPPRISRHVTSAPAGQSSVFSCLLGCSTRSPAGRVWAACRCVLAIVRRVISMPHRLPPDHGRACSLRKHIVDTSQLCAGDKWSPRCLHVYVITWPRRGTASMSKRSCVWQKWHILYVERRLMQSIDFK